MSVNTLSFDVSDTWLPKQISDCSWPSRPSTSEDESGGDSTGSWPPVSFSVPPPPLSSTWPLRLNIPPPSISQAWPSTSAPSLSLNLPSPSRPTTTSPSWPSPPHPAATLSSTWPSSSSSSLPTTISPLPDTISTDNPSPSRVSPDSSSTAGFGWNLDLSRQLAEKLMLVDMDTKEDQVEEEDKLHEDSRPLEDAKPRETDEDDSEEDGTANPRFKTEICRNIKEKGSCLYGDLCQFAHGKDEVRDVVKHNKYKTKLCQKYWINGYCAYGPRCNFVHYEKESSTGSKKTPPTETPSYLPPTGSLVRTVDDVINMANTDAVIHKGKENNSVNDSGNCSLGSDTKSPTPSPRLLETPEIEGELFTPVYGSGRLVAKQQNNTFTWIDTWMNKFV